MKKKILVALFAVLVVCALTFTIAACNNDPCKNGHDWEEVDRTGATCTSEGVINLKCKNCDQTKEEPIERLQHNLSYHSPVDAGCFTDGKEAYWQCGTCGNLFLDEHGQVVVEETDLVIPANGRHTYLGDNDDTPWVEWDTTDFSKVTYHFSCTDCGKKVSLEFTEGISLTENFPATCGQDAHGTYTLAPTLAEINARLAEYDGKFATGWGDDLFKTDYLWANEGSATGEHTFDEYTDNNDEATHKVECSVCGEVKDPTEAHEYTEDGGTKCKCGAEKPEEEHETTYQHVDGAVQHKVLIDGAESGQESCAFTGSDANKCVKCGYVYVADVTFNQNDYTIVASGSTGSWTSTAIAAAVSNSATESGVTYEFNHESITMSGSTVTATQLGTFTLTATSVGINKDGSTVEVSVTVVVYTNDMYLTGVIGTEDRWISGTNYSSLSDLKLTAAADNKSYSIDDLLMFSGNVFKVVYDGMDSNWDTAITDGGNNFSVNADAYYTVKVDISGTDPVVTLTQTGEYTPPAGWSYEVTIYIDVSQINYEWDGKWTESVNSDSAVAQTVSEDNPTVSITYDFSHSVFSSATSQCQIGFHTSKTSTYYGSDTNSLDLLNTDGSIVTNNWATGNWYNYGNNDALQYVGAVANKSFTFTFTFNDTGAITALKVTA